jgi:F0F1-type ATP synthase assembly protein I
MAIQDNRPTARTNESMQRNVSRSEPAIGVSYGLVGALVVLGGLGYLLDGWLDTSPWLLIVGLVTGLIVGLYGLSRLMWPE